MGQVFQPNPLESPVAVGQLFRPNLPETPKQYYSWASCFEAAAAAAAQKCCCPNQGSNVLFPCAATAAPALATPSVQKTAAGWEKCVSNRACRQRPQLPNVAFWNYTKSSHLLAFQAQKRRLRHAQTAGPWRTEKHQNCDQKLPNVTSETHRKGWF